MIVRYRNNQDKYDPRHETVITGRVNLSELLDDVRKRTPFIAELCRDNGFELVLGIGGDFAFVEHRRIDGDLPYLMAISSRPLLKTGYVEFLTANTPTPIAARYILSFDEVKQIALYFLETGERTDAVTWEAI
jgi:hypothetical protein